MRPMLGHFQTRAILDATQKPPRAIERARESFSMRTVLGDSVVEQIAQGSHAESRRGKAVQMRSVLGLIRRAERVQQAQIDTRSGKAFSMR